MNNIGIRQFRSSSQKYVPTYDCMAVTFSAIIGAAACVYTCCQLVCVFCMRDLCLYSSWFHSVGATFDCCTAWTFRLIHICLVGPTNQFDESIFNFGGVWYMFFSFILFLTEIHVSKQWRIWSDAAFCGSALFAYFPKNGTLGLYGLMFCFYMNPNFLSKSRWLTLYSICINWHTIIITHISIKCKSMIYPCRKYEEISPRHFYPDPGIPAISNIEISGAILH